MAVCVGRSVGRSVGPPNLGQWDRSESAEGERVIIQWGLRPMAGRDER